MKYFTPDFVQFFKDLSSNNHKEWFHANKKRYEAEIKKPFANLVTDLISEVGKFDKIDVEAKDCILRINRDIRFAKDKTPYNLHVTAFISKGGRKDKSLPGLFVRLSAEMVGIMGGCFGPDKEQLRKIRSAIAKNPKNINGLLANADFISKFGEIKGDTMKRIPKEWVEASQQEPLILNKQFYYVTELEAKHITSDALVPTIMEYYQAMKPINDFLMKCIGS